MKLSEAIRKQVEIVCENLEQRKLVIDILNAASIPDGACLGINESGLCVALFRGDNLYPSGYYGLYVEACHDYPVITATDFISANS